MRKACLLLGVLVALLTGCEAAAPGPQFNDVSTDKYGCTYLIDEQTGVVYLEFRSGDLYGITVMLNADGTPVTAKQLELEQP